MVEGVEEEVVGGVDEMEEVGEVEGLEVVGASRSVRLLRY